jgi:hypothetical protein
MAMAPTTECTLFLTVQERDELLKILEVALADTHAERRRTEAPAYHEQVAREESVLRDLVNKVRQLTP